MASEIRPKTARRLKVECPGALSHVMNRGHRRRFLGSLGEDWEKTGWQVHALCLMLQHFRLIVETPRRELVAGMK